MHHFTFAQNYAALLEDSESSLNRSRYMHNMLSQAALVELLSVCAPHIHKPGCLWLHPAFSKIPKPRQLPWLHRSQHAHSVQNTQTNSRPSNLVSSKSPESSSQSTVALELSPLRDLKVEVAVPKQPHAHTFAFCIELSHLRKLKLQSRNIPAHPTFAFCVRT